MRLSPGDRVVITRDVLDWSLYSWIELVLAPKGSTARVLSFDEYNEIFDKDHPSNAFYPEYVRKAIIDGEALPVQLESVEPCERLCFAEVGGLVILESNSFNVIES